MGMIRKLINIPAAYGLPRRHRCVMCEHSVRRFKPYRGGKSSQLMRELGVIGSDVANFECPRCGAHDRERHLLMYLEETGMLAGMRGKSVLHFAPEKRLSLRIINAAPAQYVPCDLYPNSPDVQRVDMLQMQFTDQSFDLVIASHVLEHVDDDLKALSEIRRVLKPGGYSILQTPYSGKLHHTWRDPGIDTDAARLQAYGQADHVRLFGRDIFARFASADLVSYVKQHHEVLPNVDAAMYGINPNEPLFLFRRPE